MNEASAREVVLLQAYEIAVPPSPAWSDDDRAWATRLALKDGDSSVTSRSADTFIARRAHHAIQRLGPREPAAAKWLARRAWRPGWVGAAALAGLVAGLLADSIGGAQRINLLAPPLWGVVLWNVAVYLLLLGHALASTMRRATRPGLLNRAMQRLLRLGGDLPRRVLPSFAAAWSRVAAPLSSARAATLLHVAAAALGLGLIGGLYLRGLVFDYRAAWESTFLSAAAAHAALSAVLAPAVAVSAALATMLSGVAGAGITLPDVAGFEALREAHGATSAGASAAPWIHLFAITLVLFVVLPRLLLALAAGLRAWQLARSLPLPLAEPYFQRLLREQTGDVAHVVVMPYAATPSAQAALGLRAILAPAFGDNVRLQIAPTTPFGAEDTLPIAQPAGTTLVIALFDLAATPEAENHGRFARQLAAADPGEGVASTILMADETGFIRRFGADSARLEQRRDAWRSLADGLGATPLFVDLDAPDVAGSTRALRAAISRPVTATR